MSDLIVTEEKIKPGDRIQRSVQGVKECGHGQEGDAAVGEEGEILSEYSFKWWKMRADSGEVKYVRKVEYEKAKEA